MSPLHKGLHFCVTHSFFLNLSLSPSFSSTIFPNPPTSPALPMDPAQGRYWSLFCREAPTCTAAHYKVTHTPSFPLNSNYTCTLFSCCDAAAVQWVSLIASWPSWWLCSTWQESIQRWQIGLWMWPADKHPRRRERPTDWRLCNTYSQLEQDSWKREF